MTVLASEYRIPILIMGLLALTWLLGAVTATLVASRNIGMDARHQHELLPFYLRLAWSFPLLLFGLAMNWLLNRLPQR